MQKLTKAISVLFLALAAGCDIGPISHESVVNSLSRYVSESVARRIVDGDKMFRPKRLPSFQRSGASVMTQ